MHLDVVALRDFYYGQALGRMVKRRLQAQAAASWGDAHGLTVAGFGFAAPFMRPFRKSAARLLVLMPAAQGVALWPSEGPNAAALVEPHRWPLSTSFVDRLLLAHALETADRPHELLDECWRVLTPEGRLLIIAPNRAGLWARRDGTPFGYGRPYSSSQLEAQLAAHGFQVAQAAGALYMPPSLSPFWRRAGPLAERLGRRLDAQRFAGVLIVEAIKRVTAPRSGLRERAAAPGLVFGGILAPQPDAAPSRRSVSSARKSFLRTEP